MANHENFHENLWKINIAFGVMAKILYFVHLELCPIIIIIAAFCLCKFDVLTHQFYSYFLMKNLFLLQPITIFLGKNILTNSIRSEEFYNIFLNIFRDQVQTKGRIKISKLGRVCLYRKFLIRWARPGQDLEGIWSGSDLLVLVQSCNVKFQSCNDLKFKFLGSGTRKVK